MSIIATQRPGIYSDYQASSVIWGKGSGKTVGIVAASSATSGQVYTITNESEAITTFGSDTTMTNLCKTAIQNGAIKIAAVPVSESNYGAAFGLLENIDGICAVICDSETLAVHKLLETSVNNASQNNRERIGIISYPAGTGVSAWGAEFNNERMVLIAQNPVNSSGELMSSCFLAAAFSGGLSQKLDPSESFNGDELSGILGLTAELSEEGVDDYIEEGITPFETVLNSVEVIRAVSSRTTTNNVADSTFKDLNTILIIDYVMANIRESLETQLSGAKNNQMTRTSIASQTAIKLEEFKSDGIIDAYENPVVSQDGTDPSICVVRLSFTVSRNMNQIHISADIKV